MSLDIHRDIHPVLKEKGHYSPENLASVVDSLNEKGVSRKDLSDTACGLGLRSCSYGSLRHVFPIMGAFFGTLIGVGTGLLSNEMCERLYATGADKIIANGISAAFPLVFFTQSGYNVRESQDHAFYHGIKEIFREKLSR